MTVIVSACLAGINCRYDGGNKKAKRIVEMVEQGKALPVCPEQLGGLPTPRMPADFVGGDGRSVLQGKARIVNRAGEDVTEFYIKGAREVLYIARLMGAREAYLKTKSPACGYGLVYIEGELQEGVGVCAALLEENGIKIIPWEGDDV